MTLDEAYRKGQYDMRKRIMAQWRGWFAGELAMAFGVKKAADRGELPRGNVPVIIRKNCKVRPLEGLTTPANRVLHSD